MYTQPESRVLIELCLTCFRVAGDICGKQLVITFNLRRRCVGVNNRLHDSACTKNGRWSKRQNVAGCPTLGFVSLLMDTSSELIHAALNLLM